MYALGKRKVSQKMKRQGKALCLLSKHLLFPVVNFWKRYLWELMALLVYVVWLLPERYLDLKVISQEL